MNDPYNYLRQRAYRRGVEFCWKTWATGDVTAMVMIEHNGTRGVVCFTGTPLAASEWAESYLPARVGGAPEGNANASADNRARVAAVVRAEIEAAR